MEMSDRTDLIVVHPGSAGVYGDLDKDLVAVEPPMWARLIASYVRDHGFAVQIVDAEADQQGPHEVGQIVRDWRPRLVCIAAYGHQPSASTQTMAAAGAIARAIKNQSDVPVIMVGGHVSALPETTMREERIDYACVGEGPATVLGLLQAKPPATIPGLVWVGYGGSALLLNPPAPLLDPGKLRGDAWDLLPMHKYRAHNWQGFGGQDRTPYASIYTTLGCPYRCAFCCINAPFGAGRTYRMRNPGEVVAEIAMLYRHYSVRTFKIVDEMFVLNERHYTAICQGLVDRGIGQDLNIWAYARVDTVKPHTLALLRAAGIRWLALGIESGSAFVRDGADKSLKADDIESVVRAIQAAGINVIANYIFGLPDDDQLSMMQTQALAQKLNTEFANFYCAMAYPGSPLYAEARQKGWTLPDTWLGYSQHSYDSRPMDTKHVDAATVLAFRDQAFEDYFTNPSYLDMVADKFGPVAPLDILEMSKHKLRRRLLESGSAAIPA